MCFDRSRYLFNISMNSITGPLLPLVAFAICCAAFAILKARFKQRRTLNNKVQKDQEIILRY